jgi:phosphatidylserine/phosphatidylglycerophosphate/cardiolipin synthase-like enzyme
MRSLKLCTLAFILCGCSAADVPDLPDDDAAAEASPDESFMAADGRALGMTDTSDDGRAVVRAANLATVDELVSSDAVGLVATSAKSLVAYRRGPDGVDGTADDRTIATLAELDAVPWIGKRSLTHLLAWARAQGFAAPKSCGVAGPRATSGPVLVTPDDGPAPFVQLIAGARRTIDVVMYELSSADVIQALEDATQRGVRVRVIVDRQQYANPGLVGRLNAAGVQAKLSSTAFTYTHEKTIVVDRRVALIFTGNLDHFSLQNGRNFATLDTAWQDIDDLEALFAADWAGVAADLTCTRLVVSPVNSRGRILDVIGAAKSSLDIEALYITDADVIQAILDAHGRGVAIRVLINDPSFGFGSAATGQRLVAAGVPARRSSTTHFVHAKTIVVDGTSAYLGSENFSTNSLLANREVGAWFAAGELDVARMSQTFATDWGRGISF